MSWYNDKANQDNIVISSRIRLARNIKDLPFPSKMKTDDYGVLNSLVRNAIFKKSDPAAEGLKMIYMKDIPQIERFAMVERHVLSREFVSNCENKAIIISDDESVCVMLGEEDHIRIQVLLSGAQIEKAYEIAENIDKLFCENLDIAYDERLGFLTECPTNLGTGLRASMMLHLPIIEAGGEMQLLADSFNKIGFAVRGMYGEGTKAMASLYQISNQITLGIDEKSAIDNLKTISQKLCEKENLLRSDIDRIKVEDICMRALGTLKCARILDSNEMMKALSNVKLGIAIGIIEDTDIFPIKLLVEGQPYMLMRNLGDIDAQERDINRANMIRNAIS